MSMTGYRRPTEDNMKLTFLKLIAALAAMMIDKPLGVAGWRGSGNGGHGRFWRKMRRIVPAVLAAPALLMLAAVIERTDVIEEAIDRTWEINQTPFSGTSGTLAGQVDPGGIAKDVTNGILYQNEGTKASPYWTPVNYEQEGLLAFHSGGWKDQLGKAFADTAASAQLANGLRVFGQGVEVNGDSGLTVATGEVSGNIATLQCTNEDQHLAALGTDANVFQPDTHGACLVVEAEVNILTDLVNKLFGIGFIGTAADALDPPTTNVTVTITNIQPDLALLQMDDNLTDALGLMQAWNRSNVNATLLVSATGVDTGVDIAAVGTFARYRVELQRTTTVVKMVSFKDKVQIGSIANAYDEDEECAPVVFIVTDEDAVEAIQIKHFAAWGLRA